MNFLEFPVEVGVIIFKYLDTKTKINLYNCSNQIKEYFTLGYCYLNNIVLSRSTLATVRTLNETLFLELGEHLRDLNLSGVQDLTVEKLKPHMNRFVNLKFLDLTFTNIYITDIEEICPKKVKHLGINFFKYRNRYINESISIKCRKIFKERHFETVHFVVFEFVYSSSPLLFLKGMAPVNDLKLTIIDNVPISEGYLDYNVNEPKVIEANYNQLTYLFSDYTHNNLLLKQLNSISGLIFSQIEYIFIMNFGKIYIYVSPVFANLFTSCCTGVEVTVNRCLPQNFAIGGNIVFKAWNKARTKFDDKFLDEVLLQLKDYFPTYICMRNQNRMQIVKAPSTWFCIDYCVTIQNKISVLPEKLTLTDFCRREGTILRCPWPYRLLWKSEKVQHLTFLSINSTQLSKDFFTNLFTVCPKLVTLNMFVMNDMLPDYTQSLSKVIHLAKLKNFMLISGDIEYTKVFEILSHCTSLENVHIREYERLGNDEEVATDNLVVFIEQCVSLFIEANMTAEGLTMLMAPLRVTAQALEREYLSIEVCKLNHGWNPFVDVFNPSPLDISH